MNCLSKVGDVWMPKSGSELIYENDTLVTASHTLSATLIESIKEFPLDRNVPYDPCYIVDWPSETYQIALGDASQVARWRILSHARPRIEASILESYKDLQLSMKQLVIESYKLILVPLWIARYQYESVWYNAVINGQNGTIHAEKPQQGIKGWLTRLLNE